MTHDEVGELAAERYILHEMSEPETEAFEQHYFDCVVCAHDVRSAYAFHDSVRASALCEPATNVVRPAAWWRRYVTPLAAAASMAIGIVGMQYAVVAPQSARLAAVLKANTPAVQDFRETRGEARSIDHNALNELNVEMEPGDETDHFTWTIVDAANKAVWPPKQVIYDQVKPDVPVSIQPNSLQPGNYTLRVISKRPAPYQFAFTVR